MIAIKSSPKRPRFVVCDGVMEEYAKFQPDGTFQGSAGISVFAVSRAFPTLEEAKEAMEAYKAYAAKYRPQSIGNSAWRV